MIRLLVNLLTPYFESLGVSPADVEQYGETLSGYIDAIFILLLVAIAVIVIAHWKVKKGKKHVVRWTAAVSWVIIVGIIVNVISFGPMYNNIAPILNGKASVSEESVAASRAIIEEIGDEGMVLVKNDEAVLPLTKNSNINVFGWASTNPIYGGTGSGSAAQVGNIDIINSLTNAGFNVNQDIIDMYNEYQPTRASRDGVSIGFTDWSLPEPPVKNYTDSLMRDAKSFSDMAVIVIGRSGGEGQDEPLDMNAVINGTYDIKDIVAKGHPRYNYFTAAYTNNGDYDDFETGMHYLELTVSERNMVEKVCSEFDDVVVVINANNAMELGWVNEYESIDSVILAPGTGATGMAGLGKILNGTTNPSGRTVDTYMYDLTDTPAYNNWGNFSYTNVGDIQDKLTEVDKGFRGALSFVNYVEGIYVGYKYFETASEENFINYNEKVLFPFGHGLSYTSFDKKIVNFNNNGDDIAFDVKVTNTGDVSGKDVVEIYFTPPYSNGGIEKASVNLIDFEKTKLLQPGASETISFIIHKEEMASYDSKGLKTINGGYVLEAGDYKVSLRSNSHTIIDEETFPVTTDINYSVTGRNSDDETATNQFQDYALNDGTHEITYLSRADSFGNYNEATSRPADNFYIMNNARMAFIKEKSTAWFDQTKYDNSSDVMPTTGADNGLMLADLTGKSYDDSSWEKLLDQLTFDDLTLMVNLGGFNTAAIKSIGKVQTQDSDGTSGLNDWYIQVYGTAYSTELLIAQSWNKDLAYRIGQAEGDEYADCRIFGTYSPAMNIHRTAFGGRNFEYYSEDGVLSGHIAASTINGLATKGVYAYLKHFALNDQETDRSCLLQTFSDEQAIREIYLKPFEYAIKDFEGTSIAIMSSFNFIGDRYAGSNPNLLNNVLRGEWGFRGMVLSDWYGSYGYQNTVDSVLNGNDVMLGFNNNPSSKVTHRSATVVKAMRQGAKNISYTVANSGNYTVPDPDAGKMDPMNKIYLFYNMIGAIILLGILAIIYIQFFKKKSKNRGI